jgi:WD40 repeat protein
VFLSLVACEDHSSGSGRDKLGPAAEKRTGLSRGTVDLPYDLKVGVLRAAVLSRDRNLLAVGWAIDDGPQIVNQRDSGFKGTGSLHVWNLRLGKEVVRTEKQDYVPWSVAFSPDNKTVASIWDKWICVHELGMGKEILKVELPDDRGFFIGFSSDGQRLITGSRTVNRGKSLSGCICIWDAAKGNLVSKLYEGKNDCITTAALSFDGRTLALSRLSDNSIRVLDLVSGRETYKFSGHKSSIDLISFSADGGLLASASFSAPMIFVWDVRNGRELRRYRFSEHYSMLFFSRSGRFFAASKSLSG